MKGFGGVTYGTNIVTITRNQSFEDKISSKHVTQLGNAITVSLTTTRTHDRD